eukprot:6998068-Prymnesium_polylepis.2
MASTATELAGTGFSMTHHSSAHRCVRSLNHSDDRSGGVEGESVRQTFHPWRQIVQSLSLTNIGAEAYFCPEDVTEVVCILPLEVVNVHLADLKYVPASDPLVWCWLTRASDRLLAHGPPPCYMLFSAP